MNSFIKGKNLSKLAWPHVKKKLFFADFVLMQPHWSFRAWTACLKSRHSISITRPLQNWIFSLIFLWYSGKFMVPSIIESHPGPKAVEQHQTITLPSCSTVGLLLFLWNAVFYTKCDERHTFQKVPLLSRQSTDYLHKSLGDRFIWVNVRRASCSFWSAVVFTSELSHGGRLNNEHWR